MDLYGSKFDNPMLGVSLNVFSFSDSESKWFIGKEVAGVLGYSNPSDALYKRIPEQDKNKVFVENLIISDMQNADVRNNKINIHSLTTLINEAGVYRLVFGSKLPSALTFQRWVFEEVLPSIRETGGYVWHNLEEDPIEIERRSDRALVMALLKRDESLDEIISKVNYAEVIAGTEDGMLVGEFAHILSSNGIKMGRNTLFIWLREHGYLGRNNEPYQNIIESGYFKVKPYKVDFKNGTSIIKNTPIITPRGQEVVLREIQRSTDWQYLENVNSLGCFDYSAYRDIFGEPFIDKDYLGLSDEQLKEIEEDAAKYYEMILKSEFNEN